MLVLQLGAAISILKPLQYSHQQNTHLLGHHSHPTKYPMQSPKCLAAGYFPIFLFVALPASAQLVQVPDLSGFGNSNNFLPFSSIFGPLRYQQIYASSAFPHGGTIDKIMFRNDEDFFRTYATDIDIQVAFAYAATTVDTASPTFANNIGDDFTIVLDEVITESNVGSLPAATFDFVLDVANIFTYDTTQGDLLVQILVRDQYAITVFDGSDHIQQQVTTRIWSYGVNAATGQVGPGAGNSRPFGLVTQFQFVPEPSSFALFGTMLLVVAAHRRGRRC